MAGIHFNAFGPVYIDGVTFRLGEQFIPPRKVSLPPSFEESNPSEIVFMDYDFSKEENFLPWRQQWLEVKNKEKMDRIKRIEEKEAARLEAEEEAQAIKEEQEERLRLQGVGKHVEDSKVTKETDSKRTDNLEKNPAPDPGCKNHEVKKDTVKISQQIGNASFESTNYYSSAPLPTQGLQPRATLYANLGQNMLIPTQVSKAVVIAAPVQLNSTQPTAKFNPADFEKEEDLFDELELQTINDMEELNKVLQGAQFAGTNGESISRAPVQQSTVSASTTSAGTVLSYPDMPHAANFYGNSVSPCKNCGVVHSGYCSAYANVFHKQNPSVYRSYSPNHGFSTDAVHGASVTSGVHATTASVSLAYGVPRASIKDPRYHQQHMFSPVGSPPTARPNLNNNANNSQVSQFSSYNGTYLPYSQQGYNQNPNRLPSVPNTHSQQIQYPPNTTNHSNSSCPAYDISPNGEYVLRKSHTVTLRSSDDQGYVSDGRKSLENSRCATPDSSADHKSLRSAKSEPDLTACGENNLPVVNTKTCFQENNFKLPAPSQEKNQALIGNSPTLKAKIPVKSGVLERDSYSTLSPSQRQLANRIISMGFGRNIVARAVQKFDTNEKQVLDFVCGISRLCDSGIKKEDAEEALLATGDFKKALQYVLLIQRFQEFGFSQQQVQEGLLKHDMDEEKTLDWLTCLRT